MRRWLVGGGVLLLLAVLGVYFAADRVLASAAVRAQIEQQLTAKLGQPVRIGAVRASLFPGIAVDLRDVAIGQPDALHLERIRVRTGIRAVFADVIDLREIDVSGARLVGVEPPFTFDLTASVLGDRLDVTSLLVNAPSTRIAGHGVLTSIANLDGVFEVQSERLDLNELLAIGAGFASSGRPDQSRAPSSKPRPMHLVVQTTSPRVRFGSYEFRKLSTRIEVQPSRYALNDVSIEMFGGAFAGRLNALTGSAAPKLQLVGTVTGVDVAELLKETGAAGGITGTLNAGLSLAASGSDIASLQRSLTGTIDDAGVSKGTMPRLDLVRTIVLAFGKPSGAAPEGSGTAFERMAGSFRLAGGVIRSENLQFRARDFDAAGRGSLTLASGAVDARTDVVLSRELTEQAGTDLRRYAQEDGRVVVPATVSGPLTNPTVFIDVAAAAKRAFSNELKRRATDFIGGLFKKKKGGG